MREPKLQTLKQCTLLNAGIISNVAEDSLRHWTEYVFSTTVQMRGNQDAPKVLAAIVAKSRSLLALLSYTARYTVRMAFLLLI